jgi:hypothetical protein
MRLLRRGVVLVLLTSPLLTVGCKQGVNDRCQVQSDCDDGLICTIPTSNPEIGGTCVAPGGGVDLSVPQSGG